LPGWIVKNGSFVLSGSVLSGGDLLQKKNENLLDSAGHKDYIYWVRLTQGGLVGSK